MATGGAGHDYQVKMIYHPTVHVTDLDEAEGFFDRVFGRPSTSLASTMKAPPRPGHAIDYSTFTMISDVLIDSLDPKRYITDGVQRYKTVDQPHLRTFGWYVDGVVELYKELKRQGIRVTNSKDELAEGDDPPMSGPMPLFHALPADAGIRYHFFPPFPFPADPRVVESDWSVPPVSDDDPLGIVHCSHHTVLTNRLDRALKLVVDVLGGTVIHEGHDELRGVTATFVHLADAVLEYAVPDAGTAAYADLEANGPNDVYHAITWQVVDLDRVKAHLAEQGVGIWTRTADAIVTDPATSLGIPWGFTTTPIPGDPRSTS